MDYKFKTTFMQDFTIADKFGAEAIKDTYKNAFEGWHDNVEYVTELTIVLNWKIWEWYEKDEKIAKLYNSLWERVDGWCLENLKGDDLSYFVRTTD